MTMTVERAMRRGDTKKISISSSEKSFYDMVNKARLKLTKKHI